MRSLLPALSAFVLVTFAVTGTVLLDADTQSQGFVGTVVERLVLAAREVPIVNLCRALREWNWGGGSCVHASTVMGLRWTNNLQLADWWRKNYSGGESYSGLIAKLQRSNVPYDSTHEGDMRVIDAALAERRGCVIFYYPNHSILCVHADRERVIVLDNNRINTFIEIPRAEFVREWKGYGGVGVVPLLGSPRPPKPFL